LVVAAVKAAAVDAVQVRAVDKVVAEVAGAVRDLG
jgi:hypothetical protein